ncbi:helix-turn-helix domain-containing protein [Odoribacter lunatus]|uniref:helix-turn-helix domain-containing protein n=1 Tax=Odoribacter lunatus TaxID=2941335 RepID=UPI00203FA9B4|nr:helix-turn-helix transcriptional regulator [Odoribacter lunatus]
MEFPERLQSIIEERQISKYKIAKSIDISASTVSNYLKGKTKPDSTKLTVLSRLLGVNKEWLQSGEGSKYSVEEDEVNYSKLLYDPEGKHVNEKLILILDRLTESMRERDQQISMLIHKITTPPTQ